MHGFLMRLLINALALLVLPHIISGIQVSGVRAALVAALVLAIVNAIIRPIFIILTLPIEILSLGIFTFVINGLMLYIVARVVQGFEINTFGAAFFGSIVLSIVSAVLTWLTKDTS